MIALILAPVKGDPPYPPLAICALKSWLSIHHISACAIDLNKDLSINNPNLAYKIKYYFGQPMNFIEYQDSNLFSNIDTIYNFQLLLKFLYPNEYLNYELDAATKSFYNELNKQLEIDANLLLEAGYRYFGFSSFVSNICYSILLAHKLKSKDMHITTFFGGCSTAYDPIRDFLIKSHIADYVLVGEGENSILKLCNDLQNNSVDYSIIYSDNIAPYNLAENEIVVPIIKKLDELPFPDFSDLNLDNYTPKDKKDCRFLSIATSRGCINKCSYCSETQYWSRFRQRSVNNVIDEIKHAINVYHTKIFFFCDSLINGNVIWIKQFCNQLIDNELNIQWLSYATINHLDSELLMLMKKSGCISLTLGIEHISKEVLRGVNKISSITDAKSILLNCVNAGIFPIANIIYALPNEQQKDFLNLLYFVSDADLIDKVRFTFRPYEIRVGSIVTQKLMEKENTFVKHGIKNSQLDKDLQDSVSKLDLFWHPDETYINETRKKFNVLKNIIEHQNNNYLLNVSNIRNYNFPTVLQKTIMPYSYPTLSGKIDSNLSNFQSFLLTNVNGKNTVSFLTQQTVKYIKNFQQKYEENDIYDTCYNYTKKNLIELSIKQIIIWN